MHRLTGKEGNCLNLGTGGYYAIIPRDGSFEEERKGEMSQGETKEVLV